MKALLLGPGTPGEKQEAMAEGLRTFGYRVLYGRQSVASLEDAATVDLLLTFGERTPQASSLLEARRARGLRSIVYDLPLLRFAGHGEGWVGLYPGRVGGAFDGPASGSRLEQMGITCPAPMPGGDGVLLLAQVPGDCQHGLDTQQLAAWMSEAGAATGEQVTVRPHPMARWFPIPVGFDGADTSEPLSAQLRRFAGAITYNSSAQYECYASGIPVAVWARGDRWPATASHQDALARLRAAAWNDWSIRELETAEPWDVMHQGPPVDTAPAELPKRAVRRRRPAKAST